AGQQQARAVIPLRLIAQPETGDAAAGRSTAEARSTAMRRMENVIPELWAWPRLLYAPHPKGATSLSRSCLRRFLSAPSDSDAEAPSDTDASQVSKETLPAAPTFFESSTPRDTQPRNSFAGSYRSRRRHATFAEATPVDVDHG